MTEKLDLEAKLVRKAVWTLALHKLHHRLKQIDGHEAGRVLPEIWPVIQELCMIADAAEARMILIRSPRPRTARAKLPALSFKSVRKSGDLSEDQIRNLFAVMHHPDAPTRRIAEARRKFG